MTRRFLLLLLFVMALMPSWAQQTYWVFLSDKEGSSFDPYSYFDASAIERYQRNGADLYALSNYPVSPVYEAAIAQQVEEIVGTSRWLNAIGVEATPSQIADIQQLPFVASVKALLPSQALSSIPSGGLADEIVSRDDQCSILPMEGNLFREHHLDGTGVRIAVIDGGFSGLDTLPHFAHLRDKGHILDTWNFCKRNSKVYSGFSHGTEVMMKLCGSLNDSLFWGMAPEANYLLACVVPKAMNPKSEIWWVMALEWADKNGADIVNSSLGYSLFFYQPADMDGTSFIAHAADIAASKGMLICVAMGNTHGDWTTITTPADAEKVLSVGAAACLDYDLRVAYYSCEGPTADHRLKPNVVAYGDFSVMDYVDEDMGTSFATPLVAGFAACVLQQHRDWRGDQLKTAIEQSASLYPYYNYSVGYGIPKASFFFPDSLSEKQPTFHVETTDTALIFHPLVKGSQLFYSIQDTTGFLVEYGSYTSVIADDSLCAPYYLSIVPPTYTDSHYLNISYQGYYSSFPLPLSDTNNNAECVVGFYKDTVVLTNVTFSQHCDSSYYDFSPIETEYTSTYWEIGNNVSLLTLDDPVSLYSPAFHIGHCYVEYTKQRPLHFGYAIGAGVNNYRLSDGNPLILALNPPSPDNIPVRHQNYRFWNLEAQGFARLRLLQRYNLQGVFLDCGLFANLGFYRYKLKYPHLDNANGWTSIYRNPRYDNRQFFHYGALLRLGYRGWNLYAHYSFNNLFRKPQSPTGTNLYLPSLELGIALGF